MRLSRLRIDLALRFGGTVALALTVLVAALVAYLHREADQRLTRELESVARQAVTAIEGELIAEPDARPRDSARAELEECYPGSGTLLAYDASGELLASVGPAPLTKAVRDSLRPLVASRRPWELRDPGGGVARAVAVASSRAQGPRVVAARSTNAIAAETSALLRWLLLAIPMVAVLSGLGGYVLAARALRPLEDLRVAVDQLGPRSLDSRLEVRAPPDEVDQLAVQINALLARLEEAQRRNQAFLADVAHQLKTPLTVARGETTLALERPRSPEDYEGVLRRVSTATEQMSRRVDDLLLLAQAEIGLVPPPADLIELDGLAFDCCEFMRSRASVLQRSLELERVASVEVIGSEALLTEALVELIENALRHGDPGSPVRVSAYRDGDRACLEVSSAGAPLGDGPVVRQPRADGTSGGLGLAIVEWIATFHGGELERRHAAGRNRFSLRWPAANGPSEAPPSAPRA